jgi:hypothetical protein
MMTSGGSDALLRRLDEALLDGPGGDAEAPLVYAAVEIERLSPNDPVPRCRRALSEVLAEARATTPPGGDEMRSAGHYVADAEPLETAGLVRLTINSGVVDFDILLDLEQAIDLHRSIARAARAVSEAAA